MHAGITSEDIQITGLVLRQLREQAGLERSAIGAAMIPPVSRSRIVNIEATAQVPASAASRYLDAIRVLVPELADKIRG